MINGVLVERTVKDVVPALKTNSDGLKKVLDDLLKQYKVRQEEMEKWKVGSFCSWFMGLVRKRACELVGQMWRWIDG